MSAPETEVLTCSPDLERDGKPYRVMQIEVRKMPQRANAIWHAERAALATIPERPGRWTRLIGTKGMSRTRWRVFLEVGL